MEKFSKDRQHQDGNLADHLPQHRDRSKLLFVFLAFLLMGPASKCCNATTDMLHKQLLRQDRREVLD